MKKILSWFLILTMLTVSMLTLTACSLLNREETLSQEEVEDLLTAVGDNMADLDDLEIRCVLDMKMIANGVTVEIPMSLTVTLDDYNSEDPAFAVTLTGSYMGTDMDMAAYYLSGWMYVYFGETGYKQQTDNPFADMELGMEMPELPELDAETAAVIEELVSGLSDRIEAVTDADGVTEIKLELTMQELMEKVVEVMENVTGKSLEDVLGSAEIDVADMLDTIDGKAKLDMTVKEDYLTKMSVDVDLSMEVDGQAASYEIDFEFEIVDPGKSVIVTLPEGAEELPDMDDLTDGGDLDLSNIVPPLDAEMAEMTMKDLDYVVEVTTIDSYYVQVSCAKGGEMIVICYFEDYGSADAYYEAMEAQINGQAGVLMDQYYNIVWVGTAGAVADMAEW